MDKVQRCVFEVDTIGIYFTPLIGYSNAEGKKSFWFGWLSWLWTIRINPKAWQEPKTRDIRITVPDGKVDTFISELNRLSEQ